MGIKLVTPAENLPVTLEEAKAHLRVDFTDDDTLISGLIAAATNHAQHFLGRALVDQQWDYYLDAFPSGSIKIPLPPLIQVIGIYYNDSTGSEQTFGASSYTVDDASQPARIVLANSGSWPTASTNANSIRIRFRAGYLKADSPDEDSVPFDLKAAILLMVGSLYENRESEVVGAPPFILPWGAEQLMRQHRINLSLA